jgi:hypothetical protein
MIFSFYDSFFPFYDIPLLSEPTDLKGKSIVFVLDNFIVRQKSGPIWASPDFY